MFDSEMSTISELVPRKKAIIPVQVGRLPLLIHPRWRSIPRRRRIPIRSARSSRDGRIRRPRVAGHRGREGARSAGRRDGEVRRWEATGRWGKIPRAAWWHVGQWWRWEAALGRGAGGVLRREWREGKAVGTGGCKALLVAHFQWTYALCNCLVLALRVNLRGGMPGAPGGGMPKGGGGIWPGRPVAGIVSACCLQC